MKLRQKLLLFTGGLVTLVVLALTGAAALQLERFTSEAKKPAEDLQNDSLHQAAAAAHKAMEAVAEAVAKKVSGGLSTFEHTAQQSGGLNFSGAAVPWKAVNQFTKESVEVSLPGAQLGGLPMPPVRDFTEASPLVDGLTKRTGGTYTVFQRMNSEGDMLRVATSVKTKEGKRGVGTYIPASMPDGKPNPVVAAVMKGETFSGPAFVVDSWVHAEYRPLKDSSGQVIGMIYAGERQQSSQAIAHYFSGGAVGDHGRIFAIKGKGSDKGQFLVPPKGYEQGASGLELLDGEGQPYLSAIADKTVASRHEEALNFSAEVPWNDARAKVIGASTYLPEWDWVIVAEVPEAELKAFSSRLDSGSRGTLAILLTVGGVFLLLSGFGAYFLATSFSRPIEDLSALASGFAKGEPIVVPGHNRQDEIGGLLDSFRDMAEYQNHLTEAVKSYSEGDLTHQAEAKGDADVLGAAFVTMSQSLAQLVSGLKERIRETSEVGTGLSAAAEQSAQAVAEVTSSMKDVASATTESAQTASQIAAGSENLSLQIGQAKESLDRLGAAIQGVTTSGKTQQEAAHGAAETAKEGGIAVLTTLGTLDALKSQAHSTATAVRELGAKQGQIRAIVQTIDEIAGQTNLLALNAAIEAARAGDHGRGFAVVAEEVRKLAERSSEAAKQIEELIQGVSLAVNQAVSSMEESTRMVDEGALAGAKARESLESIQQAVSAVQEAVSASTGRMALMNEAASSMEGILDSIASISEENLAGAEELNAGSEELAAAAADVSSSLDQQAQTVEIVRELALDLQKTSAQLASAAAQFKIEEGTGSRLAA